MEQGIPPEWAAMFEGKTAAEIHDMRVPAHLSDEDAFRFKDYQLDRADEAFAREEGKPYIPRGCPTWPAADTSEAEKAGYANTADALDHGYGFETGSTKQQATSTVGCRR